MAMEHIHNPAAGEVAGTRAAGVVSNCCNSCHNTIFNTPTKEEAQQVLSMLEEQLPQLRKQAGGAAKA
jgi:hypothetical protein